MTPSSMRAMTFRYDFDSLTLLRPVLIKPIDEPVAGVGALAAFGGIDGAAGVPVRAAAGLEVGETLVDPHEDPLALRDPVDNLLERGASVALNGTFGLGANAVSATGIPPPRMPSTR